MSFKITNAIRSDYQDTGKLYRKIRFYVKSKRGGEFQPFCSSTQYATITKAKASFLKTFPQIEEKNLKVRFA